MGHVQQLRRQGQDITVNPITVNPATVNPIFLNPISVKHNPAGSHGVWLGGVGGGRRPVPVPAGGEGHRHIQRSVQACLEGQSRGVSTQTSKTNMTNVKYHQCM